MMLRPRDTPEPILNAEDRAIFDAWWRAAREHGRTQAFRRRVDRARGAVIEALSLPDVASPAPGRRRPSVSWSGGKDSTAMTHLVTVEAGARDVVDVVSEKDDLDFPGEREYVEGLAAAWGARLEVLTPPVSPSQWIADAAARGEVRTFDDIRSRRAGLSKACFYGLMEENDRGRTLTMLGLRREESNDRNRVAMHACMAARDRRQSGEAGPRSGLTYWHKGVGAWRCLPVAEFKALEVYAYLATRDIDPLPVYRCVALMHADNPGLIRKSWWLPGEQTANGQVAWLKRYYPSLYRRLCGWMPQSTMFV